VISRRAHAKEDKEMTATWRLNLDKILQAFDVGSFALMMTITN
jgi:hypothetical protein